MPKLVIENPKFPFSLRFKTVKGQDYEIQSTAYFQSWITLAKIKGTGTEKYSPIAARHFTRANTTG